jgi:dTDP-glucose pyrophosphorylase
MNKLEQYCIEANATIRTAFKKMGQLSDKFILVKENEKIIGIVTDGDFRRAIWGSVPFDNPIGEITNLSYIFFSTGHTNREINETFREKNIGQIPVIKNGKLVKVYSRDDIDVINKKPFKKSSNIPVIIMAGGKGTRLDPFTRILPKPLIPIGNEPIIEIIMNEFSGYGVSEFHLTLNDKSKMIKAYFHDHSFKYKIHFIEEKKPLGTAGALRLIPLNNVCSIIVTNCDIIIKDDYNRIIEYHEEMENDITLIGSLQHYKVPYGVCKVGEKGNLKSIMEKPEYDYLSNTGFYILEKSILKLIPKDRYFDMTDLINKALGDNFKVGVYPVSDRSWIDIGQWEEYRKAVNALT